ncbi:hypothetical protein [Halomonas sp. PA16-9]|uniref:hypothetical protein n=1 Tax=Halomonas sp. PA16-9 TaxID=2576841 RepID=UPI0012DA9357|nr:hypothetical protein FDY98_18300 [Halomonas sp. PA16-9]
MDIVDYLQLNAGTIAPNLEPLLVALKNYSQANGLEAEDTLITGYSLGGGMVNIMARFREELPTASSLRPTISVTSRH